MINPRSLIRWKSRAHLVFVIFLALTAITNACVEDASASPDSTSPPAIRVTLDRLSAAARLSEKRSYAAYYSNLSASGVFSTYAQGAGVASLTTITATSHDTLTTKNGRSILCTFASPGSSGKTCRVVTGQSASMALRSPQSTLNLISSMLRSVTRGFTPMSSTRMIAGIKSACFTFAAGPSRGTTCITGSGILALINPNPSLGIELTRLSWSTQSSQ